MRFPCSYLLSVPITMTEMQAAYLRSKLFPSCFKQEPVCSTLVNKGISTARCPGAFQLQASTRTLQILKFLTELVE